MKLTPATEPRTDAERVVVGFLDDWGPGAWPHMRDCYDRWLTDDVSWENTGSPPCKGKAASIKFLSVLHDTLEIEYCTAELHNVGSRGDVVLTERTDRIHLADGSVAIEIPIMGTFEVRDGKIARYADYNADSPIRKRFPRHNSDEGPAASVGATGDDATRAAVGRLVAIEEIRQLKARYFRYVDTKRWAEFADLFTDDLEIDFAESTSRPMTKAEFVASAERHFTGAMSVHHGHVPEIEIVDGTHARGIWPMFDLVETPADSSYVSHTGWGHYTEEYRLEPDGRWRISRTRLSRLKRVVLDDHSAGGAGVAT